MREDYFKKMYLGEFKADKSFESILKIVKNAPSKYTAELLFKEIMSVDSRDEEIKTLRTQLAKANERVAELEKELKESEDDLDAAEQQLSSYENALEEVQAVFVDSDARPLFEPFNPRNLSAWLNKFAIEKKIEALEFILGRVEPVTVSHVVKYHIVYYIEQLRKEQE